jgi:biotin carboxyl carrier protein
MNVRSLVNDARVLLAQLQRSHWSELHVRTPQGEIFIGRPGAGPNPLRRVAPSVFHEAAHPDPPAVVGTADVVVCAPHVGTVREVLPARTRVEANAVVLCLVVLDEVIEVQSPHAGVVGEIFVTDGAFVEYESPLFSLMRTQ